MPIVLPGISPYKQHETDLMLEDDFGWRLIVWNDDVNTFDWVIKTLVEICGHDEHQAEQCALLIHTKGKYAVKQGSYETLKPLCEGVTDRGLSATLEEAD